MGADFASGPRDNRGSERYGRYSPRIAASATYPDCADMALSRASFSGADRELSLEKSHLYTRSNPSFNIGDALAYVGAAVTIGGAIVSIPGAIWAACVGGPIGTTFFGGLFIAALGVVGMKASFNWSDSFKYRL